RLRQDEARVEHEVPQEAELGRGQLDLLVRTKDLMTALVEDEGGEARDVAGQGPPRGPPHPRNPPPRRPRPPSPPSVSGSIQSRTTSPGSCRTTASSASRPVAASSTS